MFADEDEDVILTVIRSDKQIVFSNQTNNENFKNADHTTKQYHTKSIASHQNQSSHSNLHPYSKDQSSSNEILSPPTKHQENNNQYYPPSDSKLSSGCSISSLRSTLNSDNFGLNTRMKAVLHSSASRHNNSSGYSSHTSSSGETPVIYTLNNSVVPTQTSIHCGPHYGLSEGVWQILQQTKGIKNLYEWQNQCLQMALKSNQNLLYSLPTSGGKTLVAEILMVRELLVNRKHCLFIMPYVSIVQEKMRALSSLAVPLDFAVEEYAGNRGTFPPRKRKSKCVIYIATQEKAHGIINSLLELGRISEIGIPFFLKSSCSVNIFSVHFRFGCS